MPPVLPTLPFVTACLDGIFSIKNLNDRGSTEVQIPHGPRAKYRSTVCPVNKPCTSQLGLCVCSTLAEGTLPAEWSRVWGREGTYNKGLMRHS